MILLILQCLSIELVLYVYFWGTFLEERETLNSMKLNFTVFFISIIDRSSWYSITIIGGGENSVPQPKCSNLCWSSAGKNIFVGDFYTDSTIPPPKIMDSSGTVCISKQVGCCFFFQFIWQYRHVQHCKYTIFLSESRLPKSVDFLITYNFVERFTSFRRKNMQKHTGRHGS